MRKALIAKQERRGAVLIHKPLAAGGFPVTGAVARLDPPRPFRSGLSSSPMRETVGD